MAERLAYTDAVIQRLLDVGVMASATEAVAGGGDAVCNSTVASVTARW